MTKVFLVVDFFNQISMLYGTISEFCTAESCPKMNAGSSQEYYWMDTNNIPIQCPAPIYIDYLMTWVQDELDNENIFPSQIGIFLLSIKIFLQSLARKIDIF